jgi:hypothetical protein
MKPSLRKTLTLLLALGLSSGPAFSALNKELRHPQVGLPAYQLQVPSDWLSNTAGPTLSLASPGGTTSMALVVLATNDTPDLLAAQVLKQSKATETAEKKPADISGHKGFTWFATMLNPQGVTLKLEMTIVQAGPGQIASAMLILAANVSPEHEADARRVRGALKLVSAATK